MEWGFAMAIIGIIVVLISTIWYFASYLNQLHSIAANGPPAGTQHSQPSCPVSTTPVNVPATAANIGLKEALAITSFPTLSVIGWLTGAGMIIGGTIWGLISRSRNKPDSSLSKLMNSLILQQEVAQSQLPTGAPAPIPVRAPVVTPAPRVTSPVPSGSVPDLTPVELAKLKALLGTA